MKKKILLMVGMLALAALACALPFANDPTDTDEPDREGDTEGNILFEDDFSDTDSGWDRTDFAEGYTDYDDGVYRIFVNAENWSAWANPSRNFDDVSISVQTKKTGGDDDNEYGVICRHANIDNFYLATISSDGFYGFWMRQNGEALEMLNMENMLTSSEINLGEEINFIRLDCVGSTLTLYVNGEYVDSTEDGTIDSGDIGLYAGTFSIPGTDILFDNIVVREP